MTTPPHAEQPHRRPRGAFAVTVASAAAAAASALINGPARLLGWSLQAGEQSAEAMGTVTSPAAFATIAATGTLPQGRYRVTVVVSLAGTLAQATDANNMRLSASGSTFVANLPVVIAAGDQAFGPFDVEITAAAGGVIAVAAVNAGSVGSIYSGEVTANQDAQGTITDAGQVVAVWAAPSGEASNQWLGDEGVYIGSDVQVHVAQGDVSGVVWVRKYDDYC